MWKYRYSVRYIGSVIVKTRIRMVSWEYIVIIREGVNEGLK